MTRRRSLYFGAVLVEVCILADPVHGQLIYWTDWGGVYPVTATPTIRRIESDGARIQDLVTTGRTADSILFDPQNGRVYWVEWDTSSAVIRRANPDGSQVEDVVTGFTPGASRPTGIDLGHDGMLYWCQDGPPGVRGIYRSNLDGADVELLVSGIGRPAGIAIDRTISRMYWIELVGGIYRANLDGSEMELVLSGPLSSPNTDLAVDSLSGRIYWSQWQVGISRINRNGSGHVLLVEDDECGFVRGLAVEPSHNALYWTCEESFENDARRIRKADLDGSGIADLIAYPSGNPVISLNDVAVAPSIGTLFWTSQTTNPTTGRVQSTDLRFGGVETVVDSVLAGPRGIALDPQGGKMYWNDLPNTNFFGIGRILRSNLDGSDVETLLTDAAAGPYAIALDVAAQQMYWTDFFQDAIFRANLDGSNPEVVLAFQDQVPYGLALDPTAGKMYWTLRGSDGGPGAIGRSNLDGTDLETLVLAPELLFDYPGNIALDIAHEAMYWVSFSQPRLDSATIVQRASMDGQAVTVVEFTPANDSFHSTVGLYVDETNGKLYWTEFVNSGLSHGVSRLRRSNLDGSEAETLFTGGLEVPFGIARNPSPHIMTSDPPHRAIDARQPHDLDDPSVRFGWDSIDLTFSAAIRNLAPANFVVTEVGGEGPVPAISSVIPLDETRVRLEFDRAIVPGAWTCVRHVQSATGSCLGFLPGDADNNRTSSPVDILRLIDGLNGVADPPFAMWQQDINRSGAVEPSDILREIDLLNGAAGFDAWFGATLPQL